ncbi:MAG: S8 family serine peptidase [Chloroflexota bacterium]
MSVYTYNNDPKRVVAILGTLFKRCTWAGFLFLFAMLLGLLPMTDVSVAQASPTHASAFQTMSLGSLSPVSLFPVSLMSSNMMSVYGWRSLTEATQNDAGENDTSMNDTSENGAGENDSGENGGRDTAIQDEPEINTLLIRFEEGTSQTERNAVIASLGGTLVHWYASIWTAEISINLDSANSIGGHSVSSHPTVAYIEPEVLVTGFDTEEISQSGEGDRYQPNDPDVFNNLRSYAPALIGLDVAWAYTRGSADVIIAVLDTGLNLDHPEFAGRIVPGYDFVNDDDDPTDDNGHGTHAAGIIAAAIDNNIGSAGVCPQCSIMPIKVLNENNAGTWAKVASGIHFAVDNGATIINLSLGAQTPSHTIESAINYAVEHGVMIVAAAGNAATDTPFYPAAFMDVVAVGATRMDDTKWSLSNYGDYIDVTAPGVQIFSTSHDLDNEFDGFTLMSGTSMAAPHVAGLAGLLASEYPKLSAGDVANRIYKYSNDLGAQNWDDQFGHGRINAAAAMVGDSPSIMAQNNPDEDAPGNNDTGEYTVYVPVVVR